MWEPGFDAADNIPARLYGYHRALCIRSLAYRGTERRPGLIFGLDRGGSCAGRALLVSERDCETVYNQLMRREMILGVYDPKWLSTMIGGRMIQTLCFVADQKHHQYTSKLPINKVVNIVSKAKGSKGPNLEYVTNTCEQLLNMGISCPDLRKLSRLLTEQN